MTIDEAIKELTVHLMTAQYVGATHSEKALRLGIEALKRCKAVRYIETAWDITLLPGETEE